MSSPDFKLSLEKKIATITDLVDLVTRGARANSTISDTTISDLTSTLSEIRHTVNNYVFRNTTLRNSISPYISNQLLKQRDLANLPLTPTH